MNRRHRCPFAALALILAVSGCNSSGLVEVSGRLTYKGQPVPSTYVIFQPEDPAKRASHGLTDDDGRFNMTNSRSDKGVYCGLCTVVLKYHVSSEEEMGKTPPKASKELKAVIARYGDMSKSTIHREITKNGQYVEIELE
jgi:hypothetical protein